MERKQLGQIPQHNVPPNKVPLKTILATINENYQEESNYWGCLAYVHNIKEVEIKQKGFLEVSCKIDVANKKHGVYKTRRTKFYRSLDSVSEPERSKILIPQTWVYLEGTVSSEEKSGSHGSNWWKTMFPLKKVTHMGTTEPMLDLEIRNRAKFTGQLLEKNRDTVQNGSLRWISKTVLLKQEWQGKDERGILYLNIGYTDDEGVEDRFASVDVGSTLTVLGSLHSKEKIRDEDGTPYYVKKFSIRKFSAHVEDLAEPTIQDLSAEVTDSDIDEIPF